GQPGAELAEAIESKARVYVAQDATPTRPSRSAGANAGINEPSQRKLRLNDPPCQLAQPGRVPHPSVLRGAGPRLVGPSYQEGATTWPGRAEVSSPLRTMGWPLT